MVIFNGFDPFFGPNGTPLVPRWTLGVIWRHNRNFHFFPTVIFYGFDTFFGPNVDPIGPKSDFA